MTHPDRRPHLRRSIATLCLTIVTGFPVGARAAALSENVPVPGGMEAAARVLGVRPPERARFLVELTRVIYDPPEGKNSAADVDLRRLVTHLSVIGRFQAALAPLQSNGRGLTLATMAQRDERGQVKSLLELVGWKLRQTNKTYTIETGDDKGPLERARALIEGGIDLEQIVARLNAGEAATVDVPTDLVPVPLSAATWSDAVFHRQVTASGLFEAIVGDRQAALLSHGLAGLEDETLQFLVDHGTVLTHLYEHDAAAFGAFGESLRVRNGRLMVPGGDEAIPLWEAAVEEKVSRPDRFIRELFAKDAGHLAYLYSTVAHLDKSRAAFALGFWMNDRAARAERFKALAVSAGLYKGWEVKDRPFIRPPDDVMMLIAKIAVDGSGAPTAPAQRHLWTRAFEGVDVPDDAARMLRNGEEAGVIDAAWLSESIRNAEARTRGERLDQLAFGQRVFSEADESSLPDVLVAIRAFPRYRMLMLTLERIGVRKPSVYAAAARQANHLSALDGDHGFVANSQYQGALAIIGRMVRVHSLGLPSAEGLILKLSEEPLNVDGWYGGKIARWTRSELAPAIHAGDSMDAALLAALSGSAPSAAKPTVVSWEDRNYRLDLGAPELHRLTRTLEKLSGEPVDRPLALQRVGESLLSADIEAGDLDRAITGLKALAAQFAPARKERGSTIVPSGVGAGPPPREILDRAIDDLSKITRSRDMKRAERVGTSLLELVDRLLGDAFRAIAYALDLGDPDGTALLAGNISLRHDFGYGMRDSELRLRAAWEEPHQKMMSGVPWHVGGSLLGLDLALAPLSLRRISGDMVGDAPVLTSNERETFTKTVALLNAFDMRDVDRDAIAQAIERGRGRVTALVGGTEKLDPLADEIAMDGWRRRALQWTLVNDPAKVPSFFSMTDLLYLGRPEPAATLDGWGMAATSFSGCVCTRLAPPGEWVLVVGRPQLGVLATEVSDLNLHVAVILRQLNLPAALTKGVLAAATQDYIDEVRPIHQNDWLTMVRSGQSLTRDRVEDYVAGLTADGPLVPESGGGRQGEIR